jgi:hypothetical protein
MESFFFLPQDHVTEITVPYVAQFVYDGPGASFTDFPKRMGFLDKSFREIDFAGRSALETASLLQSWLFFGCIVEFFGRAIDPLTFVEDRNGRRIIMSIESDCQHDVFTSWQTELARSTSHQRKSRQDHITAVLEIAREKIELFDFEQGSNTQSIAEIALSVRLLLSSLRAIAEDTFRNIRQPFRDHLREADFFWSRNRFRAAAATAEKDKIQQSQLALPRGCYKISLPSRLLIDRLVNNGWCRKRALEICRRFDVWTVNYLALVRRHLSSHISHSACSQDRCNAYDVDLSDREAYKPRHVSDECRCEHLSVPTQDIMRIIQRNDVPIIQMDINDSQVKLSVTELRPWTKFIAISHVWADGLGNPETNSLPCCQVRWLAECLISEQHRSRYWSLLLKYTPNRTKQTTKTRGRLLFWMDTFCIPACLANHDQLGVLKSKAISRMAPVYAQANYVLALDSELSTCMSHSCSGGHNNDDELAGQILCSGWMSRSWTLQEGTLAQSCLFKFGNALRKIAPTTWVHPNVRVTRGPMRRRIFHSHRQVSSGAPTPGVEFQRLRSSPITREAMRRAEELIKTCGSELQEEKRYLSTAPSNTVNDLIKASRASQFVKAWNSLLCRSTSQPQDGHGILANLIDFNAYHVLCLPIEKRLPIMIRSCSQLPLSLIYNQGPRLVDPDYPGNGWIPTAIEGDSLLDGAVMRRHDKDNDGSFLVDLGQCPGRSPSIYLMQSPIPSHIPNFLLNDSASSEKWIIELPTLTASEVKLPEQRGGRYALLPQTCIFIDEKTGSDSLYGFRARGAIFNAYENGGEFAHFQLEYISPLIAWTPEQWSRRSGHEKPLTRMPHCAAFEARSSLPFIIRYG